MMAAAPKSKRPKTGGRKKGARNKATIDREEKAKADIAASVKAAAAKGVETKYALHEMQKAVSIAEGFTALHQPRVDQDPQTGARKAVGGDMKLFGEWFDRYFVCLKELARFQTPTIKPIDAPAAPPDPGEQERKAKKRFGLRVFDGGRQIQPLKAAGGEE